MGVNITEIMKLIAYIEPRDKLMQLLQMEKEKRKEEEIPSWDKDEHPFIMESMWQKDKLLDLSFQIGCKTEEHGYPLTKSSLIRRLSEICEGTAIPEVFYPTMIGKNWKGWWLPLLTESLWASFFVVMSLILVYNAYIFAEYLHDYFECSYWSNTYTLKCYVTKKVRYHLEDLNYNIVYTTLCALSLTGASILMRLQKYTKKILMINE